MAEAEAQTLRRVRAYLDRGRPLAGLPLVSLRAQWTDASLALLGREDDSRTQEFTDFRTEFYLPGLENTGLPGAAGRTRFEERFRNERRKRNPDLPRLSESMRSWTRFATG